MKARGSGFTGWLVGIFLAIIVNGAVFYGLRPVPNEVQPPSPPLRLVSMTVAVPPEPLPPAVTTSGTVAAAVSAASTPVAALPALELPSMEAPALAVGSGPVLGNFPPLATPVVGLPVVAAQPVVEASTEVIEPPVLQGGLDLDRFYPYIARSRGLTGTSRLSLDLDANGAVTEVHVLGSTPTGVFDAAAVSLARTLRFQPARRGGRPLATTTSLTIAWTIK